MVNPYTEKEQLAIKKARKLLEKAGIFIEEDNESRPDGLDEWLLHSGNA